MHETHPVRLPGRPGRGVPLRLQDRPRPRAGARNDARRLHPGAWRRCRPVCRAAPALEDPGGRDALRKHGGSRGGGRADGRDFPGHPGTAGPRASRRLLPAGLVSRFRGHRPVGRHAAEPRLPGDFQEGRPAGPTGRRRQAGAPPDNAGGEPDRRSDGVDDARPGDRRGERKPPGRHRRELRLEDPVLPRLRSARQAAAAHLQQVSRLHALRAPVNFDSADYRMFTDFAATAAKRTTRAALAPLEAPDGTARTVKASARRDFVGNVGRFAAKRRSGRRSTGSRRTSGSCARWPPATAPFSGSARSPS